MVAAPFEPRVITFYTRAKKRGRYVSLLITLHLKFRTYMNIFIYYGSKYSIITFISTVSVLYPQENGEWIVLI